MNNELLRQFDDIRPFEPEELPAAYDRLLANTQFVKVMAYVFPGMTYEELTARMRACKTNIDFQMAFGYPFLKGLIEKASRGCDFDFSAIDNSRRYTFISNHRDIVLDSAFLDKLLIDAGFGTTCEIAIGDNLLSLPWVKDLVRINKSFIVERGLPMRQMLLASQRLSDYMHLVVGVKHDNIWIAQREGRAKDSDDRTQEALLKMMAMGGEGSAVERLAALHIVPMAISYEFDPCDFLKARELQFRRDDKGWKKGPMDDVESMQTGIIGYKGRIHYHCAPCIDEWLTTLDRDMPKQELYAAVAAKIDRGIFANYSLYPSNYVALDMLQGTTDHDGHYTAKDKEVFGSYLDGQLKKIIMPNPDYGFLKECILKMYANPAINHLRLKEEVSG